MAKFLILKVYKNRLSAKFAAISLNEDLQKKAEERLKIIQNIKADDVFKLEFWDRDVVFLSTLGNQEVDSLYYSEDGEDHEYVFQGENLPLEYAVDHECAVISCLKHEMFYLEAEKHLNGMLEQIQTESIKVEVLYA